MWVRACICAACWLKIEGGQTSREKRVPKANEKVNSKKNIKNKGFFSNAAEAADGAVVVNP